MKALILLQLILAVQVRADYFPLQVGNSWRYDYFCLHDSTACRYAYDAGTFVRTIDGMYASADSMLVYEVKETLYSYEFRHELCDTDWLLEYRDTSVYWNNAIESDASISLDRNEDVNGIVVTLPQKLYHDYGPLDTVVLSEYRESIGETVAVYAFNVRDSVIRLSGTDKSVILYRLDHVAELPCSALTDTTYWCDSVRQVVDRDHVCREDRIFMDGIGMLGLHVDYRCINTAPQKYYRQLSLESARIDGVTYAFTDTTMTAGIRAPSVKGLWSAYPVDHPNCTWYDIYGRRITGRRVPVGLYFRCDTRNGLQKVMCVY